MSIIVDNYNIATCINAVRKSLDRADDYSDLYNMSQAHDLIYHIKEAKEQLDAILVVAEETLEGWKREKERRK